MKYLVTWNVAPLPPAMAKTAAALLEATKPWIENEMKTGGIVGIWWYSEGRGGVAIVDHDSNDVLYAKLMEAPFAPFCKFCIKPLADVDLVIKTSTQFYKKMAEA